MNEYVAVLLLPFALLGIALVPTCVYLYAIKVRARKRMGAIEAELNVENGGVTI